MFGYVSINRQSLSETEYERFRAFYCGLCRTLKAQFGSASCFTLSYDMTVLDIILCALYEPEETGGCKRCAPHWIRPHRYVTGECSGYAADMNIALAYYKCLDDWHDEHRPLSALQARSLKTAYEKVESRWSEKCRVISEAVGDIRRLEKEGLENIDAAADCTGRIIGEIYAWKNDFWNDTLRRMGHALGRFIYLMDAYDDLPADLKKGRANPLAAMSRRPDYEEEIHQILTLEMAECSAQFERLPIIQDENLIRNILYSGVWCKYAFIQAQKDNKNRKGKEKTT